MIRPDRQTCRHLSEWCLLLCLGFSVSCARMPVRGSSKVPVPAEGGVALYRASLEAPDEARRFRLRLWVAPPDRLHAEVLSPVGQTVLILDGGEGRLSVLDVAEKIAFTGEREAAREAFDRWLGTDWTTEELVTAILGTARPSEPWKTVREGREGRFPGFFQIDGHGVRLSLELKRWRPEPLEASLGEARIPEGYRERPLAEWDGGG